MTIINAQSYDTFYNSKIIYYFFRHLRNLMKSTQKDRFALNQFL